MLFEYVIRENMFYMCYKMSIKQEACINVDLFLYKTQLFPIDK